MLLAALLTIVPSAQAGAPDPRPGFVVVAPAGWIPALAPFAAERAKELRVEVVALEDAIAAEAGADPPERLKRALHRAWKERGALYVLLAGDADVLPVRFMVLDRWTEAAANYAFYASDLYYADVADARGEFESWNASADDFHARYYGEVRGESIKDSGINFDRVSYVPELAVGRWPVSSADELAAVAKKTLAWKPVGAAPRALLVHADGWIDARARLNGLAGGLVARGFDVQRQLYGGAAGEPTPKSVAAALLGGVDLAFHAGHGSDETWDRCLGPAERDASSAAHPAVFFSVGCSTGHFCNEPPYMPYLDETLAPHKGTNAGEVFRAPPPPPACLQTGPYNSTGLGERLVRMPQGGAVVYIGCNTGAQPCAVTLLEGFAAAIGTTEHPRLGDAWRAAIAHYWEAERLAELVPNDDWYPPSIFFQGMKFMYFGDPTLPLAR